MSRFDTVPDCDRRTDRQTDRRIYDSQYSAYSYADAL